MLLVPVPARLAGVVAATTALTLVGAAARERSARLARPELHLQLPADQAAAGQAADLDRHPVADRHRQVHWKLRVDAVANVSAGATRGLRGLEAVSVEGSAVAIVDVLNPTGQTLVAKVPTTIAKTDLPVSGGFDTTAVGSTPSLVFPKARQVKLTVRDLVLTLSPRLADGTLSGLDTFETECFQDAGQANTLATIQVVDPAGTPDACAADSDPDALARRQPRLVAQWPCLPEDARTGQTSPSRATSPEPVSRVAR